MKIKKIILFPILASLLILSACAHNYGPGAKTAVIFTPECLDCEDTVIDVRRVLDNVEGVFNYYIDKTAATIRITYDSGITSAEKIAQLFRDEDLAVG